MKRGEVIKQGQEATDVGGDGERKGWKEEVTKVASWMAMEEGREVRRWEEREKGGDGGREGGKELFTF